MWGKTLKNNLEQFTLLKFEFSDLLFIFRVTARTLFSICTIRLL